MPDTMPYDKPIANFIQGLDNTGHVGHSGYPTHQTWPKTSVTIHHNGGNLTLAGILQVWVDRPASAHFQVDVKGNIGQYVETGEFAWATASTDGNEHSISIETADATLNPWTTSPETFEEAARLTGWLFAHEIEGRPRPSAANVFPHRHWTSTDCPGPYLMAHFAQLIARAGVWYDQFTKSPSPSPAPSPTPTPAPGRLTLQQVAQQVINGLWGNGPDRVAKLKAAGYDPVAVQAEVNKELGNGPSIEAVARDVINGKYGNGPDRMARLKAAGYNPITVQAEVNRLLA